MAAVQGLVRMIRSWERGDHAITERYELLYGAAFGVSPERLRRSEITLPASPRLQP
jgi:hypothetical protein